jgi:hypothetical protein
LIEKIDNDYYFVQLVKVIVILKNRELLAAAERSSYPIRGTFEKVELVKAGFASYESELADWLWENREKLYETWEESEVIGALGRFGQLTETLDLLIVLKEEVEKRMKVMRPDAEAESEAINSGKVQSGEVEMKWHVLNYNRMGTICEGLDSAIELMKDRALLSEPLEISTVNDVESFELNEAKALETEGEGQRYERKAAYRYRTQSGEASEELEFSVLKVIVAFANTAGGIIDIGIRDDSAKTIGIEEDFSLFDKKKDPRDSLTQRIRERLRTLCGKSQTDSWVIVGFPEIEGKRICRIEVRMSPDPIHIERRRKGKNPEKHFYIRDGSDCLRLEGDELTDYIRKNFPRKL